MTDMPLPLPDYYDDLNACLDHIETVLADGVTNRKAPAHHPVVASLTHDGAPTQRVMILREIDWQAQRMRFHTDRRSAKVGQVDSRQEMSVLIYDEAAKLQLRFEGTGRTDIASNADEAWTRSTAFARRCYMAEAAPGSASASPTSGLPSWIEGKQPDEAQLTDARDNFAVLYFAFDRIDWLYLANAGHRRAQFIFDPVAQGWSGQWVVP
ncbi:pyridoxamine 5'-phosphate oxidase family protein [Sphingorhabdus arenilitoris]|uniref:Pyridoxamine 5'-phosphate oxidase family protein n=1 Tax=Sphingorhabdus arenilitoris TaxID=1490041 RepID=A0ABV8RGP8_9SPHN